MSGDLRRLGEEAAKLPVGALLLQDEGDGRRLLRRHIQGNNAIIPGRQIRNHELCAVGGLALRAENPAQKFGAFQRLGAFGL